VVVLFGVGFQKVIFKTMKKIIKGLKEMMPDTIEDIAGIFCFFWVLFWTLVIPVCIIGIIIFLIIKLFL
jgi:hypothetical protein